MKKLLFLLLICCFDSYPQHIDSELVSVILNNKDVINDSQLLKCDTIAVIYKSEDVKFEDYEKEYTVDNKLFRLKLYSNEFVNGIHNVQTTFDYKDKLYYCKKIFVIVTSLSKKKIKVGVFNPYTGSFITIHYKLKKNKYIQTEYVVGAI